MRRRLVGNALRAFGATLSTLGGLGDLMQQIQAERVNRSRVQALQQASDGEPDVPAGMALGQLGQPPSAPNAPAPDQPASGGDALAVPPSEGSQSATATPVPTTPSTPTARPSAGMAVPKRPLAPWEVYRIAAARQLKLGDIQGAQAFTKQADDLHKNALDAQSKELVNQEIESKMLSGAAATIKSSIADPAMRQDAYQRLRSHIQSGPLGGILAGLPDQVNDDVLDAIIAIPETTGERLQQQREVIARATAALSKLGIVDFDRKTGKPIWDAKFKEEQDAEAAKMMSTSSDDDSWQVHLDWVKRNLQAADTSRFAASFSPQAAKDALAMSLGAKEYGAMTGTLPTGEPTEAAKHDRAMENRPTAAQTSAGARGLRDDPDALSFLATQYRILGTPAIPTRIGEADRVAVIKEAAAQAKLLGQSPAVATQRQAAFKADASALTQMRKMSSSAESFENKAVSQIDIIRDLSSKVDRTFSPFANGLLLAGKTEIAGDSATSQLFNAIMTFSSEYAKIMEGSTGSAAASSDAARKSAEKMIKATMNPGTLSDVMDLMRREMGLTLKGYDATIDHITKRMGGTTQEEDKTPSAYTGEVRQGANGPIGRLSDGTIVNLKTTDGGKTYTIIR